MLPTGPTSNSPTIIDNYFDSQRWHELFKESVEYRNTKFGSYWKEVADYASADPQQFTRKVSGDLSTVVNIPHVKLNIERKVASLSGVKFFPVLNSDVSDLPNYQTVQQMILRWAWRTARADSVLTTMLWDLCSFGIAVGSTSYDKTMLDGRGAVIATKKDITNFYFDPNRRDVDINVDCRWIVEVTCIPTEDAREIYRQTEYPFKEGGDGSNEFFNGMPIYGDELKVKAHKRGYQYLGKFSIERVFDGKKRIFIGIMDLIQRNWVIAPYDNGIGRYDYFVMSLPLKGGCSYPEPPVISETGLSDVSNVALSLFIDDGLRTGSPMWGYHSADQSAKRALEDPNSNKPGGFIPYDVEPPTPLISPRAVKFESLFYVVDEKLRNVGNSQQVLTGENSGIRSARQYEAQQSAASVPMKNYSIAYEEAAIMLANNIFANVKRYIRDARFVPIDLGNQKIVLPVNIAEQSQEMLKYEGMNVPPEYTTETARVTSGGETSVVSRPEAQRMLLEDPSAQVVLTVNDIAYGNAECSVDVEVEMSPMDKRMLAQTNLQIGILDPVTALRDQGYRNPEQIIALADARNQVVQAGTLVMQDPLMNALFINPELRMTAARVLGIALDAKAEEENPKKPTNKKKKKS